MGKNLEDVTYYKSIVGSLQHITLTRPDLSLAMNQACQFLHNPKIGHLNAVKRISRYLSGISNLGLRITRNLNSIKTLVAYSDLDWGGIMDRSSITSSNIWYMGNLLSWLFRKQLTISTSSAEVEFKALSHVTSEFRWFYYLFRELNIRLDKLPTLLFDNKSTIFLNKNPTITIGSRHIEVSYYFVWELINRGVLKIEYIPSQLQFADGFTNTLGTENFRCHRARNKVVPLQPKSISNLLVFHPTDSREDVY